MSVRRNHSSAHPGVSIKALKNGRHRLRWRERIAVKDDEGNPATDDDGDPIVEIESQSWTVHGTPQEAEQWALAVFAALQKTGTFERPDDAAQRPTQPIRPEIADLRDLFVAWSTWRKTHKRDSDRTRNERRIMLLRLERLFREIGGLPEDSPVPVSLLTTARCTEVATRIDAPVARSKILGVLWRAWSWASDEPDRWPGMAVAPRERSRVVPDKPTNTRPLDPPTWTEVLSILDAARESRSHAFEALTICAYTGLRFRQACALMAGDLTLGEAATLTVRPELGKSKAEKSGRVVPLAPALVPLLRDMTSDLDPNDPLIPVEPDYATLYLVMERAEALGVRPSVWRAARRRNKRPTHWGRAGFQAYLRGQGVADPVIDALVGHHGGSVRDRHYAPATWETQVAAVATLPELPDTPTKSNVVQLRA